MQIPVLILAAGTSSRMRGRDKLMEDVGGEPLLRGLVQRATAAGLDPWVALPGPQHRRAQSLAGLPHHPLFLAGSAEGLGGTLRDGVAALPDAPRFMILAADLPGLTASDLSVMAGVEPERGGIVIATSESGAFGHPVVFDSALRSEFALLSGDEGAKRVVVENRARLRSLALPNDHATRDLDTPEDWDEWRRDVGISEGSDPNRH